MSAKSGTFRMQDTNPEFAKLVAKSRHTLYKQERTDHIRQLRQSAPASKSS